MELAPATSITSPTIASPNVDGFGQPPSGSAVDGPGFSATLTEAGNRAATLERAESMIGERIRAPEGGCGCDALVGPATAEPVRAEPVSAPATALPAGTVVLVDPPASIDRGTRADQIDLTGHLHQAIIRNATEMIAVDDSGLVSVLAIPWARITRR